jgi:Tfp pilus assembly protein PilO
MSKLSKDRKQRLAVVAGATLGTVVLLWFVMISPLRAKLESLAKQTAEARESVAQGQRSISFAQQVTNELEVVARRLAAAESGMAAGDLYAWMIQTMNRFKASYTVDIPQISRETPTDVGMFPKFPYKAASFTIRGEAFYHDMGKFLAGLENGFPYVQVQNLQLNAVAGPKSEDNERLQFSMELLALVKPVTP